MCRLSQDGEPAIYCHFKFLTCLNEQYWREFKRLAVSSTRLSRQSKTAKCIYGDLTPLTRETSNLSAEVMNERYKSRKHAAGRNTSSRQRRMCRSSQENRDCHATTGRVYASDMRLGGQSSRVGAPESAGTDEELPFGGERALTRK